MDARRYRPLDRVIGEIDKAINVLCAPARTRRPAPDAALEEPALSAAERREAGRLMRVNHAGEVAAQALYQGQALTARDPAVAAALRAAAGEEGDHLAWCEQRIAQLGATSSRLNPLWYLGSLVIGALAGFLDRPASLGFIRETERQVESHLRNHLERLPVADRRSRAIVERMQDEEILHGRNAESMGGGVLPPPIRAAMHHASRLMTHAAYWW